MRVQIKNNPAYVTGILLSLVLLFSAPLGHAATVTISSTVTGKTPKVLGYNLAHFVAGSNAADYWRYSGLKAARAFISVSAIEPNDDLSPVGDNVTDAISFDRRKSDLRTNVRQDLNLSSTQYVNWPIFKQNYAIADTGSNNLFSIDHAFSALRAQGTEILANISCSPSRFPLTSDADWAGRWEIWQHYYAQAFYLAKTYDVQRYGIMNEPNNWTGVTPETWLVRLRITSDAIQSAIADVNQVYNKSLQPQIFAPNTANGATKYDDYSGGDYWGKLAVDNRHLALDGSVKPSWLNFHIYNYQRYSTLQYSTASATGYIDDFNSLTSKIANTLSGTGESFPLALTEFNSRTASNYDTMSNTSDTPADYAALGASLVALSKAQQLYLFKFGMTDTTGNTYPVSKNGTHYVDNVSSLRAYGGPSSTAEVYRLYNKAAQGARDVYAISGAPTDVWTLATKDATSGIAYIFVANKTTSTQLLDFSVSSLAIPNSSRVMVEEVSASQKGGVRLITSVASGAVPAATMPAQSVWLISVLPSLVAPTVIRASANTTLKDGSGKNTSSSGQSSLAVRADSTVNGRSVTLLKFPVPAWSSTPRRILLSLQASTISKSGTVQAHIYGLERDDWSEGKATFSNMGPQLKQGVVAGSEIVNNVIEDSRSKTKFQGQIWVTSTTASEKLIDVTDFVRNQTDGFASFILVQEHRWTKSNQLNSKTGDIQIDGIKISSRTIAGKEPSLKVFDQ